MCDHAQNPDESSQAVEWLEIPVATTSFKRLSEHKRPVNKTAVNVVYFEGEHYEPSLPKEIIGWTYGKPPKCNPRPEHEQDFTGLRHGRMTAIAWHRTNKKKPSQSYWVCRCDCGRYEFRKPARWAKHACTEDTPQDKCRHCELSKSIGKGNKYQSRPGRLLIWVGSMRRLGFTDDGICRIRQFEITTRGKNAEQIRKELAAQQIGQQALEAGE